MRAKKRKPQKYNEMIKNRDKPVSKKPKKLSKKRSQERKMSNSSEDSLCRRSSRLVGRTMASMEDVSLEGIVISSDADGEDSVTDVVIRKKHKKKMKTKDKDHKHKKERKAETSSAIDDHPEKKEKMKVKISTPSKKKSPKKMPGTTLVLH